MYVAKRCAGQRNETDLPDLGRVLPQFSGYAFVGSHTGEVCGQPVAGPGRELSGLAAHLPGGDEACPQHSLHSAPTR